MNLEDQLRNVLRGRAIRYETAARSWNDVVRRGKVRVRRRAAVGVTALVSVAAVAALVVGTIVDGDSGLRVESGPVDAPSDPGPVESVTPFLLPGWLPDGYELTSAVGRSSGYTDTFGTWVYGEADEDGVVRRGVRVELRSVFRLPPPDREDAFRLRDTVMRGGDGEPLKVSWREGDIAVGLSAHGMSDEEAWRFAERLSVETEPRPSVTVEGERPIFVSHGTGEMTRALEIQLRYSRPDETGSELGVWLDWRSSGRRGDVPPRMGGDPRERVALRGREGWLTSSDERWWLHWQEAGNLGVTVWLDGGDRDELLRVAKSLERLDGRAWARAVGAAQPSVGMEPCPGTRHRWEAESGALLGDEPPTPARALELMGSPFGFGFGLPGEYGVSSTEESWIEIRAVGPLASTEGAMPSGDQFVWTVVVAVDADRCPSAPTSRDGVPVTFLTGTPPPLVIETPEGTIRAGGEGEESGDVPGNPPPSPPGEPVAPPGAPEVREAPP